MRRALLAVIALFVVVAPVSAGWSSDPLTIAQHERLIRQPIGSQTWCLDCVGVDYTTGSPWTINPGWVEGYIPPIDTPVADVGNTADGCLWDVDDTYQYQTGGNVMAAGQTFTIDECIWQGPNSRRSGGEDNYVVWRSPSPNIEIRYEWEWTLTDGSVAHAAYTLPGPTSLDKSMYTYAACVRAPGVVGGKVIAVPGSHDGIGVYQVMTVTITNTGRKVGKTGGLLGSDIRDWSLYSCRFGTVDPE